MRRPPVGCVLLLAVAGACIPVLLRASEAADDRGTSGENVRSARVFSQRCTEDEESSVYRHPGDSGTQSLASCSAAVGAMGEVPHANGRRAVQAEGNSWYVVPGGNPPQEKGSLYVVPRAANSPARSGVYAVPRSTAAFQTDGGSHSPKNQGMYTARHPFFKRQQELRMHRQYDVPRLAQNPYDTPSSFGETRLRSGTTSTLARQGRIQTSSKRSSQPGSMCSAANSSQVRENCEVNSYRPVQTAHAQHPFTHDASSASVSSQKNDIHATRGASAIPHISVRPLPLPPVEPGDCRTIGGSLKDRPVIKDEDLASIQRRFSVTLPRVKDSQACERRQSLLIRPAGGSADDSVLLDYIRPVYEEISDVADDLQSTKAAQTGSKQGSSGVLRRLPHFLRKMRVLSPNKKSHETMSEKSSTTESSSDAESTNGSSDTILATDSMAGVRRGMTMLPNVVSLRSATEQATRQEGMTPFVFRSEMAQIEQQIVQDLSPEFLEEVLSWEKHIWQALQDDTLAASMMNPHFAEQFVRFSNVVTHYATGLSLTPMQQIFKMWADDCTKPSSRCVPELLLEIIPLYGIIAGAKSLQVPEEVHVLWKYVVTGGGGNVDSQLRAPATGVRAARDIPPAGPFTLFFHRLDPRSDVVQSLENTWQQFLTEIEFLLHHTVLLKALDYPHYRTRFIAYAYTAPVVHLKLKEKLTFTPFEIVLRRYSKDITLLKIMADPVARGNMVKILQSQIQSM